MTKREYDQNNESPSTKRTKTEEKYLEDLPNDCFVTILQYLQPEELLTFSEVYIQYPYTIDQQKCK